MLFLKAILIFDAEEHLTFQDILVFSVQEHVTEKTTVIQNTFL